MASVAICVRLENMAAEPWRALALLAPSETGDPLEVLRRRLRISAAELLALAEALLQPRATLAPGGADIRVLPQLRALAPVSRVAAVLAVAQEAERLPRHVLAALSEACEAAPEQEGGAALRGCSWVLARRAGLPSASLAAEAERLLAALGPNKTGLDESAVATRRARAARDAGGEEEEEEGGAEPRRAKRAKRAESEGAEAKAAAMATVTTAAAAATVATASLKEGDGKEVAGASGASQLQRRAEVATSETRRHVEELRKTLSRAELGVELDEREAERVRRALARDLAWTETLDDAQLAATLRGARLGELSDEALEHAVRVLLPSSAPALRARVVLTHTVAARLQALSGAAASRVLAGLALEAARSHGAAAVEGLLVPLVADASFAAPQCDVVCRVAKEVLTPPLRRALLSAVFELSLGRRVMDERGAMVADAPTSGLQWGDALLRVVDACLDTLDAAGAQLLAQCLGRAADAQPKSLRLGSLFLGFVTRFPSLALPLRPVLIEVAERLQSYLRKSVRAALDRLQ